jgi:hypothetical protein
MKCKCLLQGLVLVTALTLPGACGGSKVDHSSASTSTEAQTTSPAARTSSSMPGPGVERFVGHWSVHGAQLKIESNTAGILTANCGPPCVETDLLALSLSPTGTRMRMTIAKITFTKGDTGMVIPKPVAVDSPGVGDSSYLEFVAPHLMKETIIHSSLLAIDQSGNPYWCGSGLAASLVHLCGA